MCIAVSVITNSMCGFVTSSKILRGFDRIKSLSVLVTLLTTIFCNTRETGSSTIASLREIGRLSEMRGNVEASENRMEFFDNEDILMGHSGDPWGSRNQSDYLREPRIRLGSSISKKKVGRNSTARNTSRRRPKRSVVHLYNMVVCATGCNPMSYKGYGCYCGFLGSGSAVDGIDQCCKMHDRCYDATECPTFLEYFVPYYWKCYRGYRPICAVEHGKWGGSGSCAQRLCECDRALSECLRRFPCPTSKAVCTTSPWRLIQNVFMIF